MLDTLKVYLFEATSGLYLDAYEAQRSPLEKDVFITPVYSTQKTPLKPKAGFTINYVNSNWTYIAIPPEAQDIIPAPLTLDEKRASMVVTSAQAHCAIADFSIDLYNQINTFMQQPTTAINDKIFWDKAQMFMRLSPTVIRLASQFKLTDTDVDNLFILAATKDA